MEPTTRFPARAEAASKRGKPRSSPVPLRQPDSLPGHRGAPVILKASDEEWLRDVHPGLVVEAGGAITGIIEFKASYNESSNRFLILGEQSIEDDGAITLSGSLGIKIEDRTEQSFSQLPAVRIQGIEPTADRHFGQQ